MIDIVCCPTLSPGWPALQLPSQTEERLCKRWVIWGARWGSGMGQRNGSAHEEVGRRASGEAADLLVCVSAALLLAPWEASPWAGVLPVI